MRKVQSSQLYGLMESGSFTRDEAHWTYNGLDSAVTLRVHHALAIKLSSSPHARLSYSFTRAMQSPALAMMNTGIMVQQQVRQDETQRYTAIRDRAQILLDRLADAIWGPEHYVERIRTREIHTPVGKRGQSLAPRFRSVVRETEKVRPRGLNPGSNPQMLAFFNVALKMPVEYALRKTAAGVERTPSANDKALAKWAARNTKGPGIDPRDRAFDPVKFAAPFVSLILAIRNADKMLGVLRSPIDPDGRMRCSYNVCGTENWRWSSSKNVYGRGTNLQNITASMRRMFCADDDYWLVSTDLEQAESRDVAGEAWRITGRRTYWDACLSSDLHTQVVRMAYPEFAWTGDPKLDRHLADAPFPGIPKYTYRDVAKRIGHGSNNGGTPPGIAAAVGIPPDIVAGFQSRYFAAFPEIPEWHEWIIACIKRDQYLDNSLGQRRHFFARPDDNRTLNDAKAFIQQSTIAGVLNSVMYSCWRRSILPPSDPRHLPITLLLQNHDAFAFQVHIRHDLPTVIREVNSEFQSFIIPLVRGDQRESLVIPGEFVTGYNWAYADTNPTPELWTFKDGNPDGLRKWTGTDTRVRQQTARTSPGDWLSRPIPRVFR